MSFLSEGDEIDREIGFHLKADARQRNGILRLSPSVGTRILQTRNLIFDVSRRIDS